MTPSLGSPHPAQTAPSLRRRLACLVYEVLILFGVALLAGAIGAGLLALTGQTQDEASRAVAFVIFGIYFTWYWSRRGQTLPMQTWHIRLVTRAGERLSPQRAMARYVAACIWVLPGVVLAHAFGWAPWQTLLAVLTWAVAYALLALLHPQRQFWHDALCQTQLVDAKPSSPSAAV